MLARVELQLLLCAAVLSSVLLGNGPYALANSRDTGGHAHLVVHSVRTCTTTDTSTCSGWLRLCQSTHALWQLGGSESYLDHRMSPRVIFRKAFVPRTLTPGLDCCSSDMHKCFPAAASCRRRASMRP